MAKKHRVKRQKYVEYLLRVEKERDAYLAKRNGNRNQNRKRGREERNSDDQPSEVVENLMAGDTKRVRKEKVAEEAAPSPLFAKKEEKAGSDIVCVKPEDSIETGASGVQPGGKRNVKRIKRRY